MKAPRKKDYTQRAHSNPFTDTNIILPNKPSELDWSQYFSNSKKPDFLDLGCGYGKFLFFLSEKFTNKNVLGMEIRCKVTEYVHEMIKVGRHMFRTKAVDSQTKKEILKNEEQTKHINYSEQKRQNDVNNKNLSIYKENHAYDNIAVLHTNGMLFMQNFFEKNTLEKIFVLFPDPHFKKKKQKARIICKQMLDIYSYALQNKGRIYISTDVKTYFIRMIECFEEHTDFMRVTDELEVEIMRQSDEALRAGVKTGEVFGAVYEKI